MNRGRVLLDIGRGFLVDRGDDHIDPLAARRFENEKRELAVTRDKAVPT